MDLFIPIPQDRLAAVSCISFSLEERFDESGIDCFAGHIHFEGVSRHVGNPAYRFDKPVAYYQFTILNNLPRFEDECGVLQVEDSGSVLVQSLSGCGLAEDIAAGEKE